MKDSAGPAVLMDAACQELQAAMVLMKRGGAADMEASHGPLTRAVKRFEAALKLLAIAPPSERAGAKSALETFRWQLRVCTAVIEHGRMFCARWVRARSGPGGQAYAPRQAAGCALPVCGRRVFVQG